LSDRVGRSDNCCSCSAFIILLIACSESRA
jgi:hypothetical protein